MPAQNGIEVFPEGIPFTYWEQYISLRDNFWRGIGLVFLTLAVIIVPFVVSPVAALVIVFVIFCIVIEIFGMMGAGSIKFSAIPAVSLIMSIGISVEFVAHFCLAFLMEIDGTRDQRVRLTLSRMLAPVAQGGLSTFFSILLLGFSQFEFVRRYFFAVFLMVCIIGLLNGLVLLPVLLSLVGPTALECCPTEVCRGGGGGTAGTTTAAAAASSFEMVPSPAKSVQAGGAEDGTKEERRETSDEVAVTVVSL